MRRPHLFSQLVQVVALYADTLKRVLCHKAIRHSMILRLFLGVPLSAVLTILQHTATGSGAPGTGVCHIGTLS